MASSSHRRRSMARVIHLLPGFLLCIGVSLLALAAQRAEAALFGRVYVEAIALAIVLGVGLRSFSRIRPSWVAGIQFSGREVLEVAVLLLGASIPLQTIVATGPLLLSGVVALVILSIAASYAICRTLDLPPRLAVLIACGNSICGNSAIAAVAPVIGADGNEVASAIAFTAILGVAMVLGLPLSAQPLGFSHAQYGVFAGMTVYAVPQVLAATIPVAAASAQIGTLVKLVRVMMLGPVVLAVSLLGVRFLPPRSGLGSGVRATHSPLSRFVPWFIVGFLLLALMRSLELVPEQAIGPVLTTANLLTIVAMAALGLAVDLRDLKRAGVRVTLAVTCSLAALAACSVVFIRALHLS